MPHAVCLLFIFVVSYDAACSLVMLVLFRFAANH